jgi:hypothetical protein
MNFNVQNVATTGYPSAVRSQYTTLRCIKTAFNEVEEATRAVAFGTTTALLSDLFENSAAPDVAIWLAEWILDAIMQLDHVLLVMPVVGALGRDLDKQLEFAETIITLIINTAKAIFAGPDAPFLDGTIIGISGSDPLYHVYTPECVWLSVAKVSTGMFTGLAFSAEATNNIALLTMSEGCPIVDALGAPTFVGQLLVHASVVTVIDSYVVDSGGVVVSDPSAVRLDMELFPSGLKVRKLICCRLKDGVWTTEGVDTAADSTKFAVGCKLRADRPAGPAVLSVFEDLSNSGGNNNTWVYLDTDPVPTTTTTSVPKIVLTQDDSDDEVTWWVFGTVSAIAIIACILMVALAKRKNKRKLHNADAFAVAATQPRLKHVLNVQDLFSLKRKSGQADQKPVRDISFDMVPAAPPEIEKRVTFSMPPRRDAVGADPFALSPVTNLARGAGWSELHGDQAGAVNGSERSSKRGSAWADFERRSEAFDIWKTHYKDHHLEKKTRAMSQLSKAQMEKESQEMVQHSQMQSAMRNGMVNTSALRQALNGKMQQVINVETRHNLALKREEAGQRQAHVSKVQDRLAGKLARSPAMPRRPMGANSSFAVPTEIPAVLRNESRKTETFTKSSTTGNTASITTSTVATRSTKSTTAKSTTAKRKLPEEKSPVVARSTKIPAPLPVPEKKKKSPVVVRSTKIPAPQSKQMAKAYAQSQEAQAKRRQPAAGKGQRRGVAMPQRNTKEKRSPFKSPYEA